MTAKLVLTARIVEFSMRIIVAGDGSKIADCAVRYAARLSAALKKASEILVVNVDEPLRGVAAELTLDSVARYHAENGRFALKKARSILKRAGLDYQQHLLVGDPAETIPKLAVLMSEPTPAHPSIASATGGAIIGTARALS